MLSVVGFIGLIIVLSLILPASPGGSAFSTGPDQDTLTTGKEMNAQADLLIEKGQHHMDYSTYPPTSGWYYRLDQEDITWGLYSEPIDNELQVSYLRYGGVLIQYNCNDNCLDLVEKLQGIASRYEEGVILAPYNTMNSTIALTGLLWIDQFEKFDEQRIEDFIQIHIGKGLVRME
jgi:hypothetical protein